MCVHWGSRGVGRMEEVGGGGGGGGRGTPSPHTHLVWENVIHFLYNV